MKKLFSVIMLGVMLLMVPLGTIEASASMVTNAKSSVSQPNVNPISTEDKVVTGTATKKSMITVVVDNAVYKATTTNSGDYSVNIKKSYSEGTAVSVYQTINGVSSAKLVVYVEKINISKPNSPLIDTVLNTDKVLTGTAEANLKVSVTIGADNYVANANQNGDFSIKLTTTYNEGTKIEAIAYRDNVASDKAISYVETVNITKPSKPIVNAVYATDAVVTGTADANNTIEVTIDSDTFSSESDNEGNFTVNMNKSYPEKTALSVTASKDGQKSDEVNLNVLPVETTQVTKPVFTDITDKDTLVLGKADPNVTIYFTIGMDNYRTNTDSTGNFTINFDNTYSFGTDVSAYAKDTLGNMSDTVVSTVIKGEVDLGINYITTADKVITGSTTKNSSIEVIVGNRVYEATSDSAGNFEVSLAKTYEAGTTVEVSVTDGESGKVTTKKVIVYPRQPSINKVSVGASAVTGTVDPNAYVTVYIAGKEFTGYANAAGYYSIYVNAADVIKGVNVSVTQKSNDIESLTTSLPVQ